MKARIKPLEGKYYGTEVELTETGIGFPELIKIWVMGDYEPSERELTDLRAMFLTNVGREPTDKEFEEEKAEYFCDTHYESKLGYEIACKLVEAINQ